ncbi:MAG TPA: pectate lyase [Mycobacteriales bacterium]|nr:pectate lyase [Mycobacteriales bacterium]
MANPSKQPSPPRSALLSGRRRTSLIAALAGASAAVVVAAMLAAPASAATVFTDDFNDGNASGWSKSGGTWAVVTDGSGVLQQSNSGSELAREFAGDSGWTNYTVQARVKPVAWGASAPFVALAARASSSTTFYRLALLNTNRVELQAVRSGAVTVLGGVSRTVATGTFYTLRIVVSGSTVTGSVDGAQVATGTSTVSGTGRIGLQTFHASASFDDVLVDSSAAPPTTTPPTTTPPGTTPPPPPGFPTPTGQVAVNGTIPVSGVLDGGLRRYCCIGDGSQEESQDPMFDLAAGATLANVIIGAPAGDGVHCAGPCTLRNVWWEDVGEDAATFRGTSASFTFLVDGGGARSASDKVFQHNGAGTLTIRNFQVQTFGTFYRSCGNCSTQFQRNVVITGLTATTPGGRIVGVNSNFGDTARLSNITIVNDPSRRVTICQKYIGNDQGDEPPTNGVGPDNTNCFFAASDITYR